MFWGEGGAFCAGWDLKLAASLAGKPEPMNALDFPMTAARRRAGRWARRAGAGQAGDRRGRGPGGGGRHGACHVVRRARDGRERLFRRLLPALGRAADRRRHGAPAAPRRAWARPWRSSSRAARCRPRRPTASALPSASLRGTGGARGRRGDGPGDRPLPAGVRARRPPLGLSRARLAGRRGDAQGMETTVHDLEEEGAAGAARFSSGKGAAAISWRFERMTEILFYHLQRQPLEAVLPTLLEKSLGRGWRAAVQATTAERLAALDDHLWTFTDDSFLPHGTDREPDAADQPVVLTLRRGEPERRLDPVPRRRGGAAAGGSGLRAHRRPVRRQRPGGARCRPRAMAGRQGGRPRGHLLAAGRARALGAEGARLRLGTCVSRLAMSAKEQRRTA